MAIIPTVGRRSWKLRLVIAALYIVLSLGAVTMVYPFLLMLGSSVTSGTDVNDFAIVPRYLYNDTALFAKYAEDRYAGDVEQINKYYGTSFARFEEVAPPNIDPYPPKIRRMVEDWDRFTPSLPEDYKQAGFEGYVISSPSKLLDRYQAFCRRRFGGDIRKLNRAYMEEAALFEIVRPPFERFSMREWQPDNTSKMREWLDFKRKLPANFLKPILIDPEYQAFLRNVVYDDSIERLNQAWGTSYTSFAEVHLSVVAPTQKGRRADWGKFVRENLPFRYMRIGAGAVTSYREYLAGRYKGNIAKLNKLHGAKYRSFDTIPLPASLPSKGSALVDWMEFIAKKVPISLIRVANTENFYREHLHREFGSVEAVNRAFGTHHSSLEEIMPPVHISDWRWVSMHAGALRKDFFTRNYLLVIDYVLLHGPAVLNTFIFVVAVILTHLIVNPLCAYALSRYNLPYAHKVLLFLLATMAFPAEVAMIPGFLLLKQFHMLNTYWALILPGMANGYAIFLLKGFFDSLPRELYEAGIIDGASEAMMFRKITIPMSKPIFAVIALQSFTGAYGAFMYAMLVCQDSRMWTIMVWLYQLQTTAPSYVTMAALTLAALPTLLVFAFAQNVIMRGIIIPSYK